MRAGRWGVLLLAASLVAFGIGDKERGNRLYRQGKYAEAAAAYAAALKGGDDSPELHYDYATTLLQLRRFDEADQHFRAALKNVEPSLRQRTLYNLGNRYLYPAWAAKRGQPAPAAAGMPGSAGAPGAASPAVEPPDTKAQLDAAVKAYEQALRINSRDGWAKWNLELALKEQKKQGGGGGQQQKKGGGGGGGGQQKPQPQGQGNQSGQPQPNQMSQSQAERILSAAENDERQLYKDKVKKGNREVPVARDW
ncbi:MAG TPA: tetratricopeptide repeat protein [Longimicrobiales bacterium]